MKEWKNIYFRRLKEIVPPEYIDQVIESHGAPFEPCIRINTLKTSEEHVLNTLHAMGIESLRVSPLPDAWRLTGVDLKALSETELIKQGYIYIQNPSSILCSVLLNPQPHERVLDMCAAPGSKATHLAALMKNQGEIICIEHIRKRYYKLKALAQLMGTKIVRPRLLDARRYKSNKLFDRVLLDAPCSSEGRIRTYDKKTFLYWSLRKIKEMRRKQRGLILNAGRLVRPGGTLVYATCTFSVEENEEVIDWFLRKTAYNFTVEPSALKQVASYPALCSWQDKKFDPNISHCLRILPNNLWGAFFIAQLKKI